MSSENYSERRTHRTTGGRPSGKRTGRTAGHKKNTGGRQDLFNAYLRTAIVVVAVVAVIAVIWLIVKPFRERAEKARLESAVSESEALEITVDPEAEDGSGQAGRARIPDGMRVRYDTPGWQHDDKGWWYASDEKTFYVNGWFTLEQQEYHFDSTGYMDTGWTAIGGKGCYFDEHGVYDSAADSSKMIALTFDDGPGEFTNEVLDLLEENGAKATFFMLGEKVEQYGSETIPRMVKLGCQLGNHSYDHSDMTTLSISAALQQFQDTDEQIAKYSGGAPASLIRFPYGSYNAELESRIDKPSMYWNFDTQDWTNPDAYEMAQKVISNVEGGDIVLMHDIHANTISSLKTMIPGLKEAGYQMVTLSELAAARGFEMEAGVTYFGFSDSDIAHGAVSDKKDASADANAAGTDASASGAAGSTSESTVDSAAGSSEESSSGAAYTEGQSDTGSETETSEGYGDSYNENGSEENSYDSGTSDYGTESEESGDTATEVYDDSAVADY